MRDIRPALGVQPERVTGPFRVTRAKRKGDGSDGGTLDIGIVGRLPDGREVVCGELWAMGPDDHSERRSLDVDDLARRLTDALNRASQAEQPEPGDNRTEDG